jgi:hypothetical protein
VGVSLIAAAAVAACLAAAAPARRSTPGAFHGPADVPLYQRVVERLRGGEPYYDVLGSELPSRGYATRSVFNWRTPLHLELIAHLGGAGWARGLLWTLALAAVALSLLGLLYGHGEALAPLQCALLANPLSAAVLPAGYLFSETWAGVLIAISIAAYVLGWRRTGLATAYAALFLRELALPYVVICLLFSLWERRRSECWLWLAGAGAWGLYFALHAAAVAAHMPSAGAIAGPSWLHFGGLQLLLGTGRFGLLLAFPLSVTAVYLPLAVVGALAPTSPGSTRLAATLAAYVLAFCIVGLPSNFYWGGVMPRCSRWAPHGPCPPAWTCGARSVLRFEKASRRGRRPSFARMDRPEARPT